MPWANPFQRMSHEVLELTQPPDDFLLEAGPEAVAVGLLMRARMALRASALLGDRLIGGAADPLVRFIFEACFAAGWLLAEPGAYDVYLGHYVKRWRIIAQDHAERDIQIDKEARAQLEFFLQPGDEDVPQEAALPPYDQLANAGGFGEFYTLYRMVSRRAHPELMIADAGLVKREGGGFTPNGSLVAMELVEPYTKAGMYLVAKLGVQVDARLGWGRRKQLEDLLARLDDEALAAAEDLQQEDDGEDDA